MKTLSSTRQQANHLRVGSGTMLRYFFWFSWQYGLPLTLAGTGLASCIGPFCARGYFGSTEQLR